MTPLLKKFTTHIIAALSWTFITIILLCLPGSSFPAEGIFIEIPHLDKIVHVILFGGIVVLWSLYFFYQQQQNSHWKLTVIAIVLFTILLGIFMEYIQYNFIPNRAFDKGDILANTISSLIAGILFYFKKLG